MVLDSVFCNSATAGPYIETGVSASPKVVNRLTSTILFLIVGSSQFSGEQKAMR